MGNFINRICIQGFIPGLLLLGLSACGGEKNQQTDEDNTASISKIDMPVEVSTSGRSKAKTFNRPPYQEPENLYLKNKVKTELEYYTEYDHGQLKTQKHLSNKKLYDKKGNLIKSTGYSADGTKGWVRTYTYDKAGNLIRESSVDEKGESVFLKEHSLNEAGKMAFTIQLYRGDSSKKFWYYYDPDGKLHLKRTLDMDYGTVEEAENEYSEDGYLEATVEYELDSNGVRKKSYAEEYTIDDRGLRSKLTQRLYDPAMTTSETYTYNEKGWKTGRQGKMKIGPVTVNQTVELDYFENGMLRQEIFEKDYYQQRFIRDYEYEYY